MNTLFETGRSGSTASTHEWLTPPKLLQALGPFDLDPCAPVSRPWDIATRHYTINDDGLSKEWKGRVFCNPPYGHHAVKWLLKCAEHGDATALIFGRTDTRLWQDFIFKQAHALLFIKGRLRFYTTDGRAGNSAGAPSVLIAFDFSNALKLRTCGIDGMYLDLNVQRRALIG